MKYIDADKIRAEIRRLYSEDSDRHIVRTSLETLSNLMDFLDTLEESECPEYCVRSHCIGCSKYNSDEWSNKPRKARVKATGEIVEGFTDGQGHFDVFTDHNICNRYDISAVEFNTLEEPVSDDLEEEISTWIPAHISGGDDEVWRDTKNAVTEWAGIVARHFAKWQKAKMMEGAVEGVVCGRVYDHINVRFADGICKFLEPKNISHIPADVLKYKVGDKVKVIIVKED